MMGAIAPPSTNLSFFVAVVKLTVRFTCRKQPLEPNKKIKRSGASGLLCGVSAKKLRVL
jgi:hypothetical protein